MNPAKLTTTFLAIAAACLLGAQENENFLPPGAAATLSATHNDQPFLENMGQWAPEVLYQSSFGGGAARFLENGVSFCASRSANTEDPAELHLHPEKIRREALVWNMNFANSSPDVKIRTVNESESVHNFLYGATADKQFIRVPQCEEVIYQNIYRQTDIRYYRSENGLKYDVILHPGFDLKHTELAFEGIEQLRILGNGNLDITHAWGGYEELKPYSYQIIGGQKQEVAVEYMLLGDKSFGFRIAGNYDPNYDLVIDPFIYQWGTYMGSNGPVNNSSTGTAIDALGDIYISGYCDGFYPVTFGLYQGLGTDAFVTKLNMNGTAAIYSVIFGGSDMDLGMGVDVDDAKCAYVVGNTRSTDFPTYLGYLMGPCTLDAAFVTKINANGNGFVYSTLLDGQGFDEGRAISVARITGKAFVTGSTSSNNFPVTPGSLQTTISPGGFLDAYLTMLQPAGNALGFSTYLGGSQADQGFGVKLTPSGDILVTGMTCSPDFDITAGAYQTSLQGPPGRPDGFVTCFLTGATLHYSTYLGGPNDDIATNVSVNQFHEAHVTGYSQGGLPVTGNAIQGIFGGGPTDAFVAKVKPNGGGLIYLTYLGGTLQDYGYGIAVNTADEAFVSGFTSSANFPITANAPDMVFAGFYELFVSHIRRDGVVFACGGSTFIGGSNWDFGQPKVALDPNTTVIAVVNGTTYSDDFATPPGVYRPTHLNPGNSDPVVFKLKVKCGPRYGNFDTTAPENTLTVFPNPAGDRATVNFTLTADAQTTVVAYNLQGQPVQVLFNGIAEKDRQYSLELLMNDLPAGAYMVEVLSEQWTGHSTIIRVE